MSMLREVLSKANRRSFPFLGVVFLGVVWICSSQSFSQEARTVSKFRPAVKPLVNESCIDCHDGSEENGLNFKSLGSDLSDAATFRKWERIYDRVSKGEMPPESEARPERKLVDEAIGAIGDALKSYNDQSQEENGRVILRRLTRTEYEHTLNDLLYINAPLAELIPAENSSNSFDTVFSVQGFSPIHAQSYLTAAEAALDAAIQLQQKPESKKRRFEYLDNKFVREHIDDPNEKNERVIVGELDDAVIMFNNASYLFKLDHHLRDSGWYKLRAEAYAYQTDSPVILTLNTGNYNRGFTETIGFFDLEPDGEPQAVEVETFLTKGQYLFPGAEDLNVEPDGKTIWNRGVDKYEGAGIAIKWVELEGPMIDEWPPFSTTNLLKNVKWNQRRQVHLKFEPVQTDAPQEQLEAIVAWLAPRAFRRKLERGEGTPFVQLGLNALEQGRTFEEAIRVSCRAVLASPNFLFMSPAPGKLDDFALASRLSYFLWKSMPDDELFLAARKKELTTKVGLKKQINRMLADEKSERFVSDFVSQWLRLSEIDATSPDMRLYPEFDDLLKRSMVDETELFISYLIEKDLSVVNLIDSDFAFLNRRMAEHYGIDGVKGQRFRKVKLEPDSPRGGILTQASILKVTANGTTTSPVMRGSWVLTHLLGTPPSPPPPTVGSIEPDTRGTSTIREMLEKHRSVDSCSACHKLIDPPGFALECFDVIGGFRKRFRSKENGDRVEGGKLHGRTVWEYKHGLPVDSSGRLPTGETFETIDEYKKLLVSEREKVARNLITQLIVYSTGAEIQFSDREEVERIVDRCRKSDFGVRTMIYEVIQSKLFLHK